MTLRPDRTLSRRRFLLGALALLVSAAASAWPVGPSRAAESHSGALVAIGGGSEEPALMREVLDLAQGARTRVAIVNTASSEPKASGPAYERFFKALGVAQASVVPLASRDDAYAPAAVSALADADLIYFTGGNQIRLVQALRDTPVHGALIAAWQRGAVIAGTSAGAMVWGPRYLAAGSSDLALGLAHPDSAEALDLREGLALVPDVLLDAHFERENRLGRLLAATADTPGVAGIGVDEHTAAVITEDGIRVLGSGRVTVLDFSRASRRGRIAGALSLRDVVVHLLGSGDSLKWRREAAERQPMMQAHGRQAAIAPALWLQGGDTPWPSGEDPALESAVILAGPSQRALADQWRNALAASGASRVQLITSDHLVSEPLGPALTRAKQLVLLDDGGLASVLDGEAGAQLRSEAGHLKVTAAGTAVALSGESSTRLGASDLSVGLKLVPGVIASANVWAPGAFDRLVVNALLADGALGVGLGASNAVRLADGKLTAVGHGSVLVLDASTVSLANPSLPSARDLRLDLLAPGETMAVSP